MHFTIGFKNSGVLCAFGFYFVTVTLLSCPDAHSSFFLVQQRPGAILEPFFSLAEGQIFVWQSKKNYIQIRHWVRTDPGPALVKKGREAASRPPYFCPFPNMWKASILSES